MKSEQEIRALLVEYEDRKKTSGFLYACEVRDQCPAEAQKRFIDFCSLGSYCDALYRVLE